MSLRSTTAIASLLALLAGAGCASTHAHRYPLRDPMWVDDDRRPYAPRPEEQYVSWAWDGVDNTIFRPLSELWLYEESRPAINVNAVDEVPDSSWFENRVGRDRVSVADVAAGACAGADGVPAPPWTIVAAKPNGSSPGFVIEDTAGQRYLFKIDYRQPERPTAADAIATRIFWAAGYHTPCNRVVALTPDYLRIGEGVPREPDGAEPMRWSDVEEVLEQAARMDDGRLRASLSLYLEGEPLGGWRFEGTREDDPNDVVPHEHRREARGMYVLSAWLNHIDSRAENNLDTWITVDGRRGYVRHHVLDVGDSFGTVWPTSDAMSRRFGVSHYVDPGHMIEELATLGLLDRPWHERGDRRAHPVFGYYDAERFDPDDWHNGYPNSAFERRTEHDAAWMARIISHLTEDHVRAMVAAGRFSERRYEQRLLRILRSRRRAILERYLTRLSPLSHPEVVPRGDDSELCLRDLAVEAGLRSPDARVHRAVAFTDWPTDTTPRPAPTRSDGLRPCVTLPSMPDASERRPRYLVVNVVAATLRREVTGSAQVHLYQTGPDRYRVVGLRRLEPA